ncbi:alginate lyase family protein [Olleya sp. R77988]|uniref:alginate lyase family protein n=1 Tax=Olleya sp. R77988 TaxID=3093875 RepID=UPI0037C5A8E2
MIEYQELEAEKSLLKSHDKKAVIAYNELINRADKLLDSEMFSVVNKTGMPPSKDKHDYISIGPYWWPNPNTDDGLPYIRKDGEINPEARNNYTDFVENKNFISAIKDLKNAYYLNNNLNYGKRALELINVWFLNPETMMNPHLNYGQSIPGKNDGRCFGIIEFDGLIEVIKFLELAKDRNLLNKKTEVGMFNWLSEYANWLQNSKLGMEESTRKNNHGTHYDVQLLSILVYLNKTEEVENYLSTTTKARIFSQIMPDGSQPLELKRTKSFSYSVMNLHGFLELARLGQKVGVNLWGMESKDGRSIKKGYEYMLPYIMNEKEWQYKQIKDKKPSVEKLISDLKKAQKLFKEDAFDEIIHQVNQKKNESKKKVKSDFFWKRHTIDNTLSGADGVRLEDVNNDGLLDITTGWEEGGFTKVYLHPGYEKSKEKWYSVIVGKTPNVEDAVFADLDNNGTIDVISSTEGRNNKIYINWAPSNKDNYLDKSKWKTDVIPVSKGLTQWMFAIPIQMDGKNGLDIVVGSKNKNAQIGWFQAPKNPRNVSDWKYHSISSASWIMSIILRDMDGDNDLDIVVSDRNKGDLNGVRWLENPGKLRLLKKPWKNHFLGAEDTRVMFMDLADLDNDGLEDAIVTEYTNQNIVFLKRLDNTGLNWKPFTIDIPEITGRAKAVKVGDINNDGKLDIVHTSNTFKKEGKSGVYWLSYKDVPTESEWEWHNISGPVGIKYDRVELIDLDGDGDLDVLTCEENYGENNQGLGVIWYENPLINIKNY